ncbi:hypothetical protein CC80DRAFT_548865 [Byssothecium circinans]|uniref:Uncharacterized protein n=1 Tax=Byssothecium circinans TaxID=147558 RepID=A0A6A5TTP9_9PLEO|nr:hypothetical protein CC80DRAFT_548865 [Byssothecium circinans]
MDGKESLSKRLLRQGWQPIDEKLLFKIVYFSILQQKSEAINPLSSAHLVSGMSVPLPEQSPAQRDPRFRSLRHASGLRAQHGSSRSSDAQSAVNILINAWKAQDGDGINPSLSTEFKNGTTVDLGVEIATLDVVGARTLTSLCQVILKRGFQGRGQK